MGKKIVAILLIATMAMGIAACGGSGDKKDDNTITVWCWDKTFNIFAMEEAAKIYQEDHQDVKIDIVEVGDVDVQSRLTTAGTSGDLSTLPDIFLMQDQAFQKNVLSYPDVFTEISEKKIDFSEFAPGKTDFSVVDGKHYGVPFDNGAAIACYRTDILQEAGMTLEDFTDITWDEWVEKGKVVLEKTGKPLLTTTAGECDLLTMMLQSAGASLFNEDGTTNIAKNDTLKKVIDTYCKMKDSGVLQEVNNWDEYTGVVNETDLCFIGERPHERLLGLSVDEIDVGNEYFPNTFSYKDGVYKAGVLREVVTLQTAKPLGTYLQDYNVNTPAITENAYGKGKAYYVAVQPDLEFLKEFLGDVIEEANVEANLTETLPYGVTVSKRSGKEQKDDVYFLQNFNRHPVKMVLNECYTNLITDEILTGSIKLQTYQCIVMQKK